MLVELIESKISKKPYNFELLRPILATNSDNGLFLYRVLTDKLDSKSSAEVKIMKKVKKYITKVMDIHLDKCQSHYKQFYDNLHSSSLKGSPIYNINEDPKTRDFILRAIAKEIQLNPEPKKISEICTWLNYTELRQENLSYVKKHTIISKVKGSRYAQYKKEVITFMESDAYTRNDNYIGWLIELISLYDMDSQFNIKDKNNYK